MTKRNAAVRRSAECTFILFFLLHKSHKSPYHRVHELRRPDGPHVRPNPKTDGTMRDPPVSSESARHTPHSWLVLQGHTDANGQHRIDHISQRVSVVYGIPATEFLADATLLWRLLQPDHGAALKSALDAATRAAHAGQPARPIDTTLAFLQTTQPRWLRFRIGVATSDTGASVTWDCVVEDVTEANVVRNSLTEQAAYSAMLFEQAQPAMIVLDPAAGFVDCNNAAVQLFGFPNRAAMLGKMPRDLSADVLTDGTPAEEARRSRGHLAQAMEHGIAVFEIAFEAGIADDLGRADEGEVLRPIEDDLPLAGESGGEVKRLACGKRSYALLDGDGDRGKFVADGQHEEKTPEKFCVAAHPSAALRYRASL